MPWTTEENISADQLFKMILPPMPTDDDDIHVIYCRVSGQTDRTKRIERFWIIDREKENYRDHVHNIGRPLICKPKVCSHPILVLLCFPLCLFTLNCTILQQQGWKEANKDEKSKLTFETWLQSLRRLSGRELRMCWWVSLGRLNMLYLDYWASIIEYYSVHSASAFKSNPSESLFLSFTFFLTGLVVMSVS